LFGRNERLERRAVDLDGGPVLMDRAPGGYEAGIALKTGTAAALITDHERKTVAGRIPNLDVLDGRNNATELHSGPQKSTTPNAIKASSCEDYLTAAS
jgi:hypothetical protein